MKHSLFEAVGTFSGRRPNSDDRIPPMPEVGAASSSFWSYTKLKARLNSAGLVLTGPEKWQGITDVKTQSPTIESTHSRT